MTASAPRRGYTGPAPTRPPRVAYTSSSPRRPRGPPCPKPATAPSSTRCGSSPSSACSSTTRRGTPGLRRARRRPVLRPLGLPHHPPARPERDRATRGTTSASSTPAAPCASSRSTTSCCSSLLVLAGRTTGREHRLVAFPLPAQRLLMFAWTVSPPGIDRRTSGACAVEEQFYLLYPLALLLGCRPAALQPAAVPARRRRIAVAHRPATILFRPRSALLVPCCRSPANTSSGAALFGLFEVSRPRSRPVPRRRCSSSAGCCCTGWRPSISSALRPRSTSPASIGALPDAARRRLPAGRVLAVAAAGESAHAPPVGRAASSTSAGSATASTSSTTSATAGTVRSPSGSPGSARCRGRSLAFALTMGLAVLSWHLVRGTDQRAEALVHLPQVASPTIPCSRERERGMRFRMRRSAIYASRLDTGIGRQSRIVREMRMGRRRHAGNRRRRFAATGSQSPDAR